MFEIKSKICTKCNIEKNINEFSFRKDRICFKNICKVCANIYTKEHNKQLTKENKCTKCGKLKENNKLCCNDCLKKNKQNRKKLIENKICVCCHSNIENDNNTTYCNNCLKKRSNKEQEYKKKCIDNNKCIQCGKVKNNDFLRCDNCIKKNKNQIKECNENKIKEHVCIKCNGEKEENNSKLYCNNCLLKKQNVSKQHRNQLISEHKCVKCGIFLGIDNKFVSCEQCLKKCAEKDNKKLAYDKVYKLKKLVSLIIRLFLKKQRLSKESMSILNYLPYTIEQLKQHLENQFEPWMTWENHGNYKIKEWNDEDKSTWKWQIDHIIPQSALSYTSMEDENFKKCWALENLRPLSAKENIKKGNRIIG